MVSAGCINIYLPENQATPTPPPSPSTTPTLQVPAANQAPVAFIEGISPSVVTQGTPVTFTGKGTDQDGFIIAYEWRSSLDGILSSAQSFTTNTLSVGVHIFQGAGQFRSMVGTCNRIRHV
jgi:hypothetical protein